MTPWAQEPAKLLCPWNFLKQEYRSGLLFPSPGDLSDPGIKPRSPVLQADSLPSEPPEKPSRIPIELLETLKDGGFRHQRVAVSMSANLEEPSVAKGLDKVNPHPSSQQE